MKKYIKPQMHVIAVEPMSICASSLDVNTNTGTNIQYSEEMDITWDDLED